VAAVAGALSPARPVGLRLVDALWSAAFAVAVVLGASRARRLPTIWLAGVAGVVGVGGDPAGLVTGVLSLLGAGAIVLTKTRERLLGAAVGLVASQALLRGPSYGFVGLPTLVAVVAVAPVFISAWRIGRSHERRVVRRIAIGLAIVVVVGAATATAALLQARTHVESAADGAQKGLDLLRDGDTAEASDAFSKAQYQFERASSELTGPLGLIGRVVPVVGQQLRAVREVSAAGEELAFTASQAATSADWGRLTATDGTVDLAQVREMQAPVTASAEALDQALTTVADVRSPWLVQPLDRQLDRLVDKVADAADEASIAAEGLAVAPRLLGGDGPRRYLVAFATPGESRDAGGFVGAFATVSAVDGSLTVERTGRIAELNGRDYQLRLPDGWVGTYGSYELARFPGNLSAGPDWPTDADLAAQIYAQAPEGAPIDGVIYADPAAMAALLQLTGPVDVPGIPEPLTAANAEQYLLVDQYVQFSGANDERKEVLGDAARSVFDALTSRPLPGIRKLTDVLGPAVAGGHLRIASLSGDDEQAFLRRVGIDGAFAPTEGSDYLSLRSANLIASKIDVFLHRDVTVATSVDPRTGELQTTVTVALTNDAPATGLPEYLIGNGAVVPKGTNRDFLTLFTPLSLTSLTVDGSPTAVQPQQQFGGNTYGVPVEIPAGGRVVVAYTLSGPAPAGLVATGDYTLEVLPQPTARADTWNIEVSLGDRPAADWQGTLESTLKITVPVTDG